MHDVVVAGVGMTPFGRFPDRSLKGLTADAVAEALADANLSPDDIDAVVFANALGGALQGQECIRGQVWLEKAGLQGVPTINVDNACAGGATALAVARLEVVSGHVETAIAVGAEKLSHPDKSRPLEAMAGALDQDHASDLQRQGAGGSAFMEIYAEFARRYAERSGASQADFAAVAAKSHDYGALNPKAQYRTRMTVEQILAARPVAGPLTVPMCAPTGDGAAAVVVTSSERAMRGGGGSVGVLAAEVGAGALGVDNVLVASTAARAFAAAGVGPADIDVLEIHDAASPAELIVLEQLGIAAPGDAVGMVRDGSLGPGGRLPVNPSGGLVSKGHPLGATGLAQIVELVDQLRGRAGARQVPGARLALAENGGGYLGPDAAAAVVTVLAI